MSLGLPYDSDAGRHYAGALTALMCGEAYLQSARIAGQLGPFAGYAENREPMLGVIAKHRSQTHKLDSAFVPLELLSAARDGVGRGVRRRPRARLSATRRRRCWRRPARSRS